MNILLSSCSEGSLPYNAMNAKWFKIALACMMEKKAVMNSSCNDLITVSCSDIGCRKIEEKYHSALSHVSERERSAR